VVMSSSAESSGLLMLANFVTDVQLSSATA
jgi:hypothetical protein